MSDDAQEDLQELLVSVAYLEMKVSALALAARAALGFLDEIYPAKHFTGVSGDPGVLAVVRLRKIITSALSFAESEPEAKDDDLPVETSK